jgi:hypothetical protein
MWSVLFGLCFDDWHFFRGGKIEQHNTLSLLF